WKILSMPIENKKPKVVIDTNVFISGLNFTGKPHEILELFINNEIEVFISSFILHEIEKILRKKFEWDKDVGIYHYFWFFIFYRHRQYLPLD
ncbi:unnamed protein product, partial [marine sediment metagenome]